MGTEVGLWSPRFAAIRRHPSQVFAAAGRYRYTLMRSYVIFTASAVFLSLFWWLAFRRESSGRSFQPGLTAALVGFGIWMWSVSEPAVLFSDFNVAYYPAGRAVVEDLPHLFRRCWDTPVCGFVNIPIVALLFTPFSFLTLRHAQWLFIGLSLISVVMSLFLFWSVTDRAWSRRWAMLLLFAINGPLFYSLKEGNLTHFALLLLIAGVVCLEKTWARSAGACFALAAIIKLPLMLFALYFIGRRQWEAVLGYAGTIIAVSLSSLWYAGWTSHLDWYREVIQPFSNQGLTAFNVQSIEGVLLRLQDGSGLYDWKPVPVAPEVRMIGQGLAALLAGSSALIFLRERGREARETTYLELSMVLCLALIISPISWTHYYLLLLLPLGLYAGNRLPIAAHGGWIAVMMLCALLISPPATFTEQDTPRGMLGRLFLSHYVMGAALLWGFLAYARWRVGDVKSLRLVAAEPKRPVPVSAELPQDPDEAARRSA